MSAPPILITGASGFLGRHVLAALRRERPAQRLVALVRDRSRWLAECPEPVREATEAIEAIEGELGGDLAWFRDPRIDQLGGILHLGARVAHTRHDPALWRINVESTRRLVELAASRRCRMVFASSSGTVGCSRDPTARPLEDAPCCAARVRRWPYYWSKLCAEREASAIAGERGVELVILRPPVLLGPGDSRFRSTAQIVRLLRGQLPFVVRGGIHFTDVRDVAGATARALLAARVRPVYHLPGHACELSEFMREVAAIAGVRGPRWVLPYAAAWGCARVSQLLAERTGRPSALPDPVLIEMAHHYWGLDSRYSRKELEFRPRDPSQTLRDTVDWVRTHHPDLRLGGALEARPAEPPAAVVSPQRNQ